MRLTLRTLLAYLDNTLEAQDAEVLRSKVDESGFATQLVQRIRASLANGDLAAPSPDAVGPIEEANVISEYLDSTLPSEQVAEIERACLESDMHLAEAAAVHQVLTMVLGKSAEVTPELRERIYQLPQRDIADIAAAGSFSSVAIPEQPSLGSLQDVIPTADTLTPPADNAVVPVGPGDSGVSDAPTRIRQSSAADAGNTSASTARAISRTLSSPDNRYFGGSIRPFRITPWLVSFALAGVLLFALMRIFQPVIDRYSADSATQADRVPLDLSASGPLGTEIEVPADQSPLMAPVELPARDADRNDPDTGSPSVDADSADVESLPAPKATSSPAATASETAKADAENTATPADSDVPMKSDVVAKSDESANPPVLPGTDLKAEQDSPPADSPPADLPVPPAVAAADPSLPAMKDDAASPEPPEAGAVVAPDSSEVAKMVSADTLMAGRAGDGAWVRLKKDMLIGDGATLVCAPTFRAQISSPEGVDVTAIGATQLKWLRDDEGKVTLQIDYGRVLIASTKPTSLQVRLGELTIGLEFPEVETVVAASLQNYRAPGFDPLIEENRISLAALLTVQGLANLSFDGKQGPLQTGQQWYRRGNNPPQTSVVDTVPEWIDEPDPAKTSLESMARKDLLKLIEGDQPLHIALREAMTFRKSEVGSLAAQTLLYLGHGDAYFGGDGVFNDAKQRAYWPDHYQALMININRSAGTASALNSAVGEMDAANAKDIFRLLTGYSQKQLVEGGDAELVRLLDSSSMAVRILAIENLREITGTTLYYKADQDNAIRRSPDIKKWEVRQRKGDIRWQE